MNHVGTQKLETDRLVLRRYAKDDAQKMYNNWASKDNVTKYLTWPTHSSVKVSQGIIDEGTLRSSDWNNQGICDACYYGLLKAER